MSDELGIEMKKTSRDHFASEWEMILEWLKRKDLAHTAYSPIRRSYASYLENQFSPPPPLPSYRLWDLGELGRAFIGALHIYFDAVVWHQKTPAGWTQFERSLASYFASLILALADHPREPARREYILSFLKSLNLKNWSGRPHKEMNDLRRYEHGRKMYYLWESELPRAWNMKTSTVNPKVRLKLSGFQEDVINAVLQSKRWQASVAKVYAKRSNVAFGTARNALRGYLKSTGVKFTPPAV